MLFYFGISKEIKKPRHAGYFNNIRGKESFCGGFELGKIISQFRRYIENVVSAIFKAKTTISIVVSFETITVVLGISTNEKIKVRKIIAR